VSRRVRSYPNLAWSCCDGFGCLEGPVVFACRLCLLKNTDCSGFGDAVGKLFPVGQQWNKYKGTVTEVWQDSEQNFMFHVRHRHPSIPCLSVGLYCVRVWDIEVGCTASPHPVLLGDPDASNPSQVVYDQVDGVVYEEDIDMYAHLSCGPTFPLLVSHPRRR
jgi:hypothetical protein